MTGPFIWKIASIILFGVLPYIAAGLFVWGLWMNIRRWRRAADPFKIPLTPSPDSRGGIIRRVAREIFFFETVRRNSFPRWIAVLAVHYGLLLVLLGHLRYFVQPVPEVLAILAGGPKRAAGAVFFVGLIIMLGRRLISRPMIYLSKAEDYLALGLVLAVAGTGLYVRGGWPADLVDVKSLGLGLVLLHPYIPESPGLFGLHFFLALLLLAYLPFSKFMHAAGLIFSPILTQLDDAPLRRHVKPLETPPAEEAIRLRGRRSWQTPDPGDLDSGEHED